MRETLGPQMTSSASVTNHNLSVDGKNQRKFTANYQSVKLNIQGHNQVLQWVVFCELVLSEQFYNVGAMIKYKFR